MIISPPFLPAVGINSTDHTEDDPLMGAVDGFELAHGIYPVAFDRRWHCGVHLAPDMHSPVQAIADGDVVAWRVCQHAYDSGASIPDSNAGFVLIKHTSETGDGRTLTFYSLYMHLLELAAYQAHGADAKLLPDFLRMPSLPVSPTAVAIAQSGGDHQVRRKDILGWIGRCHGQQHLHFEIFMLKSDFDPYFRSTRLGLPTATQSSGPDCWGRNYHFIPAGQAFRRLPPGTDAHNKLHGVLFEPGQDGQNAEALHLEMYFHKGTKYSKVWSVTSDGTRTPLTAIPIAENNYERDLYKRATALYPACPSDGYELLRFGRILSTPATLSESDCATWVQVTYAAGTQGYIDISNPAIIKLSDADFPFLAGWQKVSDVTLFDQDGLCDVDRLKSLLKDGKDHQTSQELAMTDEYQKEDALSRYVRTTDGVRAQLRGLVCEAPSEWDGTHNVTRYQKLMAPGEFYEANDPGYTKFMQFLASFQFWEHTGLPAGEKLCFFHPLRFIRYLRRAAWFSKKEFETIYPDPYVGADADLLREKYRISLNLALRKYGLVSYIRQAHFLGQGSVESDFFRSMQEKSMIGTITLTAIHGTVINTASVGSEVDLGHWYGAIPSETDPYYRLIKYASNGNLIASSYDWRNGNCDFDDSQKFRGRGFKQLTGRSNYADYWLYRGWISQASFTKSWWSDPQFHLKNRSAMTKIPAEIENPEVVATVPVDCIDSGAWYITSLRPKVVMEIDGDAIKIAMTPAEKNTEIQLIKRVTREINGGESAIDKRIRFTRMIKEILL